MKKGKGEDKEQDKKPTVKRERVEVDASSDLVAKYAELYQADRLTWTKEDHGRLDKVLEWYGALWVVTAVCYGPLENPDYKIVYVEAWRLTPLAEYRPKKHGGDDEGGHVSQAVKYQDKDYIITYPQLHFINKGPRKMVTTDDVKIVLAAVHAPAPEPAPVKVEAQSETLSVNTKTGELVDAITVKVTPAPEPAPMVMPSSGPEPAPAICDICNTAHADIPFKTPPCDPTCPAKKKALKKPKALRGSTPPPTPAATVEDKPTLIKPPKGARGNSWFWGLMKEGERGKDLADRLPDLPVVDPEQIVRWTKVTGGDPAVAVVAVKCNKTGKVTPCSCVVYKGQLLAGNPGRTIEPLHLPTVTIRVGPVNAVITKTKAVMPSKDGFDPRMPKQRFLKMIRAKSDGELNRLLNKYLRKSKMVGRVLYLELIKKDMARRGIIFNPRAHPGMDPKVAAKIKKHDKEMKAATKQAMKKAMKAPPQPAVKPTRKGPRPKTLEACTSRYKSKVNGTWYCKLDEAGSYCVSEVGPDVSAHECPHGFVHTDGFHTTKTGDVMQVFISGPDIERIEDGVNCGRISDSKKPPMMKGVFQWHGLLWTPAGALVRGDWTEIVHCTQIVPRAEWKDKVKNYNQLMRKGGGMWNGYTGLLVMYRKKPFVMTSMEIELRPQKRGMPKNPVVHEPMLTDQPLTKSVPKKKTPKVKDKAIKFVKMKSPPAPAPKAIVPAEPVERFRQTTLEDFCVRASVRKVR
jgi:hypothetical protein